MSSSINIMHEDIVSVVATAGYTNTTKISDTIQGSIWRSFHKLYGDNVVIKVTNKLLHSSNLSVLQQDGDKFYRTKVFENILYEATISKYLTQDRLCPNSITKFYNSFQSDINYFVVMEYGGKSLLDFVMRAFKMMEANKLEINQWLKMCKLIFKQMVECIEYIHSKNVCHFDISLENFLINDITIKVIEDEHDGNERIIFCFDEEGSKIQCKLCDYGLAQYFHDDDHNDGNITNNDDDRFMSSKYCGKRNYKGPEVIACQQTGISFNAKANDIWCLGGCLFRMIFGIEPWYHAQKGDKSFDLIINGKLNELLKHWNKQDLANDNDLMQLFNGFFRYEKDRITIEEIKKSKWLKPNLSEHEQ